MVNGDRIVAHGRAVERGPNDPTTVFPAGTLATADDTDVGGRVMYAFLDKPVDGSRLFVVLIADWEVLSP